MSIAEAELSDLIARDALARLVTAYSRAVDRRDFKALRALYDDLSEDWHGSMFRGGADDYVRFVEGALSAYEMTVHYVVNMTFVLNGDEAEGEVHKINYHRTHGPERVEIVTGSRSLDRYIRRDGVWRFRSRSICLDWARKQPVDDSAYEDFAAQSPAGRAGPEDLSYQLLRLFPPHPAAKGEQP